VSGFGPLALQRLQQKGFELGWSRADINDNVSRIKQIFRWGTSQELVSSDHKRSGATPPTHFVRSATFGGRLARDYGALKGSDF